MTQKEQTGGPTQETLRKRKIALIGLSSVFLFIALLWILYWFIWGQFEEYTDDAYVNGNMVQLMSQVSGTVVEVNTDETQWVTEGQLLVKLDSTDSMVAFEHAQAHLAQTVRQVRQYFENAAQAQQKLILDKANLVKAQLDLKRRVGLTGNRAISAEEMQHYKTAEQAAQARYNVALHQLDALLALVENTHIYTHPLVEAAKAELKTAYLNLQRTTIVAPISGYIAKRSVQPGQHVSINSVLLAIIPLHDTWVDANYKESSLNHLRVNQSVVLYADAYPDITYHGTVAGLNAGTGSAFSLLPPQNATGNWIKIVQRLPVRIHLNPKELKKNPLQLGLSMRVTVNIHELKGSRMQTITNNTFNLKTVAYEKQLADVDAVIHNILLSNSSDMFLPGTKNG